MTLSATDVSDKFVSGFTGLAGTRSQAKALTILKLWRASPDYLITPERAVSMLDLIISVAELEVLRTEDEEGSDAPGLENERFTEAHHAYMLTMGFGLDGTSDHGLFYRKANSPDEMVAILSISVPNAYTHGMTVEFSPGTSEVVHIDLQPLPEILIPDEDETLIPADAEV